MRRVDVADVGCLRRRCRGRLTGASLFDGVRMSDVGVVEESASSMSDAMAREKV